MFQKNSPSPNPKLMICLFEMKNIWIYLPAEYESRFYNKELQFMNPA